MRLLDIIQTISTTTINYFQYKSEMSDFNMVYDNFSVLGEYQNIIFYKITPTQRRKVKLDIINGNLILKNITENSKPASLIELFDNYKEELNIELKILTSSSSYIENISENLYIDKKHL